MDSDDHEQVSAKKAAKKTKGRKKSTTSKTKANRKSNTTSTRGRKVKSRILDTSSEDESTEQETKKPKHENSDDQILFAKKINVNKLNAELPSTSIGTQLFSAPSLSRVPLHENKPLNWSHKINLIGEKSLEQRVHLCDVCKEPILNYGRLLPCKHVFCYDCAIELQNKISGCLRCNERIVRCERNSLNSIYMCNYEKQCKRTYLSQRDLQAHIQHRHTKKEKSNSSSEKSIKLRTFANISKEELQPSFVTKSSNSHHHYPQPSLQTFRWVRNIQEARKPK